MAISVYQINEIENVLRTNDIPQAIILFKGNNVHKSVSFTVIQATTATTSYEKIMIFRNLFLAND